MRYQLVLGVILATVLGACAGGGGTTAPSASPTVTTAATATAAAKATCQATSVKIAVPVTPPNVVHLPPYVAQELGYFKDENLTVELVRFEGGVGALRSMAAGGVNMAGTSTEPVISAISQGVAVKIVNTYSPNISQVFAVRDTIKTPADLKGKKIGIQEPGGFADALSRAYLQKNGISASDVQFVTTTTAARVQQLVSGGRITSTRSTPCLAQRRKARSPSACSARSSARIGRCTTRRFARGSLRWPSARRKPTAMWSRLPTRRWRAPRHGRRTKAFPRRTSMAR
ncbi:MAG: ABC transporter substrate-binding protein [Chloroflexi bacterium]|nr:MAG: ABC transporter substrate-binding protein [Chloroflexota bacterium]